MGRPQRRKPVIYLTRMRLMQESERTIRERAASDQGDAYRDACKRLLSDPPRYSLWWSRHDRRMARVAQAGEAAEQIQGLRVLAVREIHKDGRKAKT